MLYEILLLIGIITAYKRLQLKHIEVETAPKFVKLSTSKLLASRNQYSTCKVKETIQELCRAIEYLEWLRNDKDTLDTTFDSPFIFEDQTNFIIPISPDFGSPALDHVELYNTAATHIRILCFQLQIMAVDRDYAALFTQNMCLNDLKILLNTKETSACTRQLIKVIGQHRKRRD